MQATKNAGMPADNLQGCCKLEELKQAINAPENSKLTSRMLAAKGAQKQSSE